MDHNYMVICYNKKRAVWLFKRLVTHLFWNKVDYSIDRGHNVIDIMNGSYLIRFVSVEEYYSYARIGYHGTEIDELDVERFLDTVEKERAKWQCTDCKHFEGCECFDGKICTDFKKKGDDKNVT